MYYLFRECFLSVTRFDRCNGCPFRCICHGPNGYPLPRQIHSEAARRGDRVVSGAVRRPRRRGAAGSWTESCGRRRTSRSSQVVVGVGTAIVVVVAVADTVVVVEADPGPRAAGPRPGTQGRAVGHRGLGAAPAARHRPGGGRHCVVSHPRAQWHRVAVGRSQGELDLGEPDPGPQRSPTMDPTR